MGSNDDARDPSVGSASLDDGSTGAQPDDDGEITAADESASTGASGETSGAPPATTTGAEGDSDDTGVAGGPIELYRGPVVGGSVPGWDPDDPRPLVISGRQGADWIATLARIDDDGMLSDNVAEELIVWGWDTTPPQLYDGPVIGGAIPGWSADAPIPVVMFGRMELDGSWVATLASIAPDGSLGDNLADRIVVWGWPAGTLAAPTLQYEGPVDASAVLPAWDPDAPVPLVMLGRLARTTTWQSTLARIGPGGELSENLATELRVWGW